MQNNTDAGDINLSNKEIEQLFQKKVKNTLFSFEDEMVLLEKEILKGKNETL